MARDIMLRFFMLFAKSFFPESVYIRAKIILGPLIWKIAGMSKPPHGVKIRCIKKFQKEYQLKIFIETGTYMGDMVSALRENFQELYSIELDKSLWERACQKFLSFSNVTIIQASSDLALRNFLPNIKQQCLFWLDAHYSGGITAKGNLECPLVGELEAIQNHFIKNHVILIDDADDFIGKNGCSTLNEVKAILKRINPEYKVEIKNNIIYAYIPDSSILVDYSR